ncbi:hypothetical protein B296_00021474 [Ensete ventricosum]|uniref:Retrotransposon gag domain-containing protein n=1 Tax=Ensete ventricosum TaxID=4639 RepID=A0A426YL72_ENSVE|nr:hypothetical protein B296_00021474 [Ensete ventricosum]
MKVDFPRWEEGDSIGWISCVERYFSFYRTVDATRVEIAAIHLEKDAIQSNDAATVHSYGDDFLRTYPGRTIESRDMKDKGCSLTSHVQAYRPLYCHQSRAPKKLTRDELHERSAKKLCWHCDEPWSREHHCKKGWLLMIEPAKDENNETSKEALEPKEEAMEEESQPADYTVHTLAGYSNPQMIKVRGLLKQQPITILIDKGSTNNFLNNKVAACLVLQIEGCNNFNVKVADSRILIATNNARG